MAWTNFHYLTNASPGATRNSGTNGDLCALLDWALPQAGWAIEFSSGNARQYRPATGNRFRLNVIHDSTVSGAAQRAMVRGWEVASSATAGTDPFPLTTQAADNASNWLVSTLANTTDRPFRLLVWDTGVIYMSNAGGVANRWSYGDFCDVTENDDPDTWGTHIFCRNSTSNSIVSALSSPNLNGVSTGSYFARDISGTIKSSMGCFFGNSTTLGATSNSLPAIDAGYLGKIRRERVAVSCFGSQSNVLGSNALIRRGFIPQLWTGLGSGMGAVTDADTFTDSLYNPGALFRFNNISADNTLVVLETTNTWLEPPVG